MPFPQNVYVVSMAVGLLVLIVALVYYGRLREEYAWLWLTAGVLAVVLAAWSRGLMAIQQWLGFYAMANVVVFFGLLFLAAVNLHAAIKISRLTDGLKNVAQEVALLRGERDKAAGPAAPSEDD
jgi:O-antigen/teichoic acid export membrane protein